MENSKSHIKKWLMILSFVLTIGFSLAYWASQVNGTYTTNESEIQIGEGDIVETTISLNELNSGGMLVPLGRANDVGEVESITLTFDVFFLSDDPLNRAAEGTIGTLMVSVESILFDGTTNLALEELIEVSLPYDVLIIADGEMVSVSIVITLKEPSTFQLYEEIANSSVEITLGFTVEV